MRNLTMRWTAVACCALSACLFAPAAARAQGSPPLAPVEDDVPGENRRAAQLYREGNVAFEQKRWAEAELLYLKAWALVRSFDTAANLGQVQLQLNKPKSAATFLAFSLRTAPPSVKPHQLARMREFLEEARQRVGAVRVQVSNVPDAEVFVDGERVPAEEAKHEIYVEPGRHQIVVRRAGYQAVVLPVLAGAGVRETIFVEMKPVEAEAVEGKRAEAKAPEVMEPREEHAPVAGGVIVAGKEKTSAPSVGAGVDEPRSWVPVIALGAASAVGLGLGVGFTVASTNANNDAYAHSRSIRDAGGQCIEPSTAFRESCAELDRLGLLAGNLGDAAFGGYIASGVFVLAAATYVLWPSRAGTGSAGVSVRPDVRLDGSGILVAGTW